MKPLVEEFGRKTVLAIAEILESLGHASLTRFLLTHGLDGTDADGGSSLRDRANIIAKFLLQNPGMTNESGESLRSGIIRDIVGYAWDRLGDQYADEADTFRAEYPDLARALTDDGFVIHDGRVRRRSSEFGSETLSGDIPAIQPEITTVTGIRIFISHSSSDHEFVRLLIVLLRSALNLPPNQIRCTSVDGYRLPSGTNADEQLRREIHDAEAFIGVISGYSLKSLYVTFELGARWGAGKHLIPVLAPGVPRSALAAPLSALSAVQADEVGQLHQLVEDLAEVLNVKPSRPATYVQEINAIQQLARLKSATEPMAESATKHTGDERASISVEAQRILIEALNDPDPTVLCIQSNGGLDVQVNEVEFTTNATARDRKRWATAVRELTHLGLLEDRSHKGEVFELTNEGWDLAEQLKGIYPTEDDGSS
jgi:hypothetical protein